MPKGSTIPRPILRARHDNRYGMRLSLATSVAAFALACTVAQPTTATAQQFPSTPGVTVNMDALDPLGHSQTVPDLLNPHQVRTSGRVIMAPRISDMPMDAARRDGLMPAPPRAPQSRLLVSTADAGMPGGQVPFNGMSDGYSDMETVIIGGASLPGQAVTVTMASPRPMIRDDAPVQLQPRPAPPPRRIQPAAATPSPVRAPARPQPAAPVTEAPVTEIAVAPAPMAPEPVAASAPAVPAPATPAEPIAPPAPPAAATTPADDTVTMAALSPSDMAPPPTMPAIELPPAPVPLDEPVAIAEAAEAVTAPAAEAPASPPPTVTLPEPPPAPSIATRAPAIAPEPDAAAEPDVPETAAVAETQIAAIQPSAPTAPVTSSADGSVTIGFQSDSAEVPTDGSAALDNIVATLSAAPDANVRVEAYADDAGDNASRARRLSLSRALAVRSYLMERGIRSSRIEVRALGVPASGAPDRVDLSVLSPS